MRICPRCRRKFVDTQDACPLDDVRLEAPDPWPGGRPPPNVGRVLGNYRLVAQLGEGGMGNIYLAAHTRINRYVAIKVLRPELQDRKQAIARFFDEARSVNRAKHPNIVESIDLVEDVVDGAYCVLELLRGSDLARRLANGPLSIESAIRIGEQIAGALDAVHALDIVHRDLKPQNLILIERGGHEDFVKLIDFGVAQISDEGATGIPFGTAAYMAPEQAAGERVDGRADVYSLGVLLFEMVTGRHPFPSSTDNEYLLRHADDPAPRPSKVVSDAQIPPELDAVILRCLAKRPTDRYAGAAAVGVALRAIRLIPRRRARWGFLIAALVLAGGGTAAAFVVPDLLRDEEHRSAAIAAAPQASVTEPPADMTISFESKPPGARVFREGETVALGKTPFQTKLPRSNQPSRIRFELAGHAELHVEVTVKGDEVVTGTLEPIAIKRDPVVDRLPDRKPPPVTKPKVPGVQREGVMDPFAKENR